MPYTITKSDIVKFTRDGVNATVNDIAVVENQTIKVGEKLIFTISGEKVFVSKFTKGAFLPSISLSTNRGITRFEYELKDGLINPYSAHLVMDGNNYDVLSYSTIENQESVFVFDKANIDLLNTNFVTITVNNKPVKIGSIVKNGDVLLAKSGTRNFFNISGTVGKSSINFKNPHNRHYYWVIDPYNKDDKGCAFYFNTYTASGVLGNNLDKLVCDTEPKPNVVPDQLSVNNVYKIDSSILSEVNRLRITTDPETLTPIDRGGYILSVIKLPYAIVEQPAGVSKVKLGDVVLDVEAEVISSDVLVLDLGIVTVPDKLNNSLSYENTTALLYLPRVNPVGLDLDYVIGCDIGIKYYIDCYTGQATINITSSKIGDVVLTKFVSLGVNIPYANISSKSVDNSNIDIGGDNGIRQPYIDIIRNESILEDGFFTIPVIDEGILEPVKGYTRIEEIELNSRATMQEKDLILSHLSSGVIIK